MEGHSLKRSWEYIPQNVSIPGDPQTHVELWDFLEFRNFPCLFR